MSDAIRAIVMPKWGLAMVEGVVTKWYIAEGASIRPGLEICDIETSKIANAMEATVSGVVLRRVAAEGSTLPVGALLAVVGDSGATSADIEAFVAKFEEEFATAAKSASEAVPANEKVAIADTHINFVKMGDDGSALLFLHGFGGDLNSWMFNQPVLAERHRTYALDLPGHGASGKAVADGSVPALSTTVAAFMDALNLETANVVGHSLGGAIALDLAARNPGRIRSLTLISTVGLGPEINRDYIEGFVAASGRKDLKPALEKLFADPALVSRDMINDVLKFKRLDGVDAALRAISSAAFPNGRQALDLRRSLAGLSVPAQVIFGADDQVIPARHAEALPSGVAVHVIPGAGHMPHMEAAGEVNRLIEAQASAAG